MRDATLAAIKSSSGTTALWLKAFRHRFRPSASVAYFRRAAACNWQHHDYFKKNVGWITLYIEFIANLLNVLRAGSKLALSSLFFKLSQRMVNQNRRTAVYLSPFFKSKRQNIIRGDEHVSRKYNAGQSEEMAARRLVCRWKWIEWPDNLSSWRSRIQSVTPIIRGGPASRHHKRHYSIHLKLRLNS